MVIHQKFLRHPFILPFIQIHILQGIVDPLCRQHRHLFTQAQIQFPAVRRWRYVDTFLIKSVNDRLHGNVAGQIPVIFSPFPSGVQVTEQTVEHHMKKYPVDMDSATLIHGKYPLRTIIDHKPIRSHGWKGRICLKTKAAESQIQIVHIQIQFISGIGKDLGT